MPPYKELPDDNTVKAPTYGNMNDAEVDELFQKWMVTHNKKYESDEEHAKRFTIFKQALQRIDLLNELNPYAVFDINERADWTEEERTKTRGIRSAMLAPGSGKTSYDIMKEEFPYQDLIRLGEQGVDAVLAHANEKKNKDGSEEWDDPIMDDVMAADYVGWVEVDQCAACEMYDDLDKVNLADMPDSFDWRALGAVTTVKNQKYCGSCWTFSTAGDVEGTHYLATGEKLDLAEQQLVACDTSNYGCDGGYPFGAMQYIHKIGGFLKDDDYPYKGICAWDACGTGYAGTPTCDTDTLNANIEDGNVANIGAWQLVAMGAEYESLMRIAMVKNGPISISFNANDMDYYVHGVVGCPSDGYCQAGMIDHHYSCDPVALDHAVLLVAYGTQDDVPYWVIKNSWGTSWGEDGYFRMIRGINHCGVANFAVHSVKKDVEE